MINQTKIQILAVSLLSLIGLCLFLAIIYLFNIDQFLFIRLLIFLTLYITAFLLLLYKTPWTYAGHFLMLTLTALIWTGTVLFRQSVNISTIQQNLLVLTISYYTLGDKWGTIYSSINIVPTLLLIIADRYFPNSIEVQTVNVNNLSYVIAVTFNFLLLMYIHYRFLKAYKISNLKEKRLKEHLQKAVIAAEELASAKTNFLSTMSHELRTPLNAVIGMTNILMVEDPKPEQIENLNILYFSAENLMATINDILDFNKIDSSTIILSEDTFSITDLMLNVYGTFKTVAREKGIEFNCNPDNELKALHVKGDQARLTQILFNLVGNALKYTSKGFVIMDALVTNLTDNHVTVKFSVEDTGIGIPADRHNRVFEPFIQTQHRSSRQHHGTGLGLTIAKRLIDLHNGDLAFTSIEGVGTVFTFTITYAIAHDAARKEIVTITRSSLLKDLRVLIAEDERINVLVMKKILKNWEITPDVAVNGQEALHAVINNDYDVVLMDINMPVMDGFEAARRIRDIDDKRKSAIPIIAVTASLEAALEQISTFKYIDDCILKPFRPEHLKEKLEQVRR